MDGPFPTGSPVRPKDFPGRTVSNAAVARSGGRHGSRRRIPAPISFGHGLIFKK
jgi:hypothetical protein